jgi:hypothetical protein
MKYVLVLLGLLISGNALAEDVLGYAEVRGGFHVGVDGTTWELSETLRPTFSGKISDRVILNTTLQIQFLQGRDMEAEVQRTLDESDFGPFFDLAGCEWPEREGLDPRDYLAVDRLYLDMYFPAVDIRIGRQAVRWGSAMLISPTDPFPELLFNQPWRPRKGINAVRATFPIKDLHQVELAVGADDTFESVKAAARGTVNFFGTDFSLMGSFDSGRLAGVVGAEIRGTLGVGYWIEGALHIDEQLYEEVAIGVDYSFPVLEGWMVGVEYFRNGGGAGDDGSSMVDRLSSGLTAPDCVLDTSAWLPEETDEEPSPVMLMRQNYGLLTTSLAVIPEFSTTMVWVQNFDDGTGMLVPMVSVRPTGWLEVSAMAQVPVRLWGNGGEFKPNPEDMKLSFDPLDGIELLSADFSGLIPDGSIYLWTRVNF